jgi:NDP-sugar pyrophosphorylase family protein
MLIETFFSLGQYRHKLLWKEGEPVWSALHQVKNYLASWTHRIEVKIPKGVYVEHPELVSIGKGTILEPGVYIQGPCVIGKGCVIRHGAYIREGVILGDGCAVGHSAELKHSILLDSASAAHFVYVGDSIIGRAANLGAGVKCANLRLDRKEVTVLVEGKRWKTGLKKMGAIVGDGVQIGCNCVLNPGTLVGRGSSCYPLVNLSGFIPSGSLVKGEGSFVVEPMAEELLRQLGKQNV